MKNFSKKAGKFIFLGLFPLTMVACSGEPAISFSEDVKPIIDQNCVSCHHPEGEGVAASGFNMASYDGLMKGAKFGPMVIAGDAEGSNMVVLMEGRADPSISMPHGQQKPVSKADVLTIRMWIDQGARNN